MILKKKITFKLMNMEMKEGQIVLFVNRNKTNDRQHDSRGKLLLNGVDYEVSLWTVTSQKGEKYASGNVNLPYKAQSGDNKSKPEQKKVTPPKGDNLPW